MTWHGVRNDVLWLAAAALERDWLMPDALGKVVAAFLLNCGAKRPRALWSANYVGFNLSRGKRQDDGHSRKGDSGTGHEAQRVTQSLGQIYPCRLDPGKYSHSRPPRHKAGAERL